MKIDPDSVSMDKEIMCEIIDRIEKRRVYFHIYHKCEMGELNEGALFCFWILKLSPFYCSEISTIILNSSIAFYFLLASLAFYVKRYNKRNKKNRTINTNAKTTHDALYAFQYRDLSKEAIMLFAEGLIVEDI
jgi:hypothetical protein